MKKLKILTVLGLMMAMGITACNKNNGDQPADESGQPVQSDSQGGQSGKSDSQGGGSSTVRHTHHYVEEITKQPTCDEEGVKTFTCDATEGECNKPTYTEAIPALGHQWGAAVDVAASGDGVAYQKFECERNNKADKAVKYEVALNKALQANGQPVSEVSGMPGFIKLSGNGTAITLKFNSDAYGKGKLYIRGSMDYWYDGQNNNENRTLFSGKDGSTVVDDKSTPNLEIKVNDVALTVTNKKPMSELLPQIDETHPAVKSGNSPAGDVLYGDDLVVGKGLNEITYTRKDSYNLAVSHLLFVFVPEAHADHTWGQEQVAKAATCTEDGLSYKECSVCHVREYSAIKAAHKWGAATPVAADDTNGYMAYNKYVCSECGKVKLEFAAENAKDAATNNKTSNPATPEHHIKLKTNGNTMTFKFNSEKLLVGQLYQEGIFDGWPANGKAFGYFDVTKTDANAEQAKKTGNFEVKINGTVVDLEPQRGKTFFDWNGDETIGIDNQDADWSTEMLCPIGGDDIQIEKGVAEIVYKRVESYNLAVKNLVFIGNEYDHEHTPATAWTSDDEGHYHVCSDANCPTKGVKLSYAKHTLIADTDETDTVSSCTEAGKQHKKCEICEKKITIDLPLAEHVWEADTSKTDVVATTCGEENIHYEKCANCTATREVKTPSSVPHVYVDGTAVKNSDNKDVTPFTCSNECGKGGAKMAVSDYSSADIDSGLKFKKNGSVTWKIIAPKAGNYVIRISAKIDSVNTGHNLSESPVTVKVGNTAVDVSTQSFADLGVGTSDVAEFVLVPTAPFVEGENTITLSQGGGGYRLTYGGNLVICEL